jgi:hypothetical protein
MSCNTVTFKRGTSFEASVVYAPEVGGLANLIGVTVTSTIIDADRNEFDLTVTVAGDGLSFTAVYPGDTGSWGIGTARWDIKFLNNDSVFYSDTMRLDVIGQVTV